MSVNLTAEGAGASALAELAGGLPYFRRDFPELPVVGALKGGLVELAQTEGAARARLLAGLADFLNADPSSAVHLMLSRGFVRFRAQAGFLTLLAYGYFLLDRLSEARWLAQGLYAAGVREAFVVSLMSRLLVDAGDFAEARALLAENRDLMEGCPELMGRVAALLYLDGDLGGAGRLTRAARDAYARGLRDVVNQRFDDILLMDAAERRAYAPEVTDVYDSAANQETAWRQYEVEMAPGMGRFRNDSCFVNHCFRRGFERALEGGAQVSINYGALYGVLDDALAEAYPDRRFVGYDRSSVARRLNRERFARPNLAFLDGVFAEAVREHIVPGRGVLGHCRTGTLMYPEDLRALYADCRELGISRIVAAEYVNYGEITGRYPDFANSNRVSTLLGGHMIQHDYAHYLAGAGYRVVARRFHPMICHRPADSHGKVHFEILEVIEAERA